MTQNEIGSDYPKFLTEGLFIREMTDEDADQLFKIRTSLIVNKYIDRPVQKSIDTTTDFINKIEEGCRQGQWYYWAICQKDLPDTLIGTICLWNFSTDKKHAEIGYELLPDFHGKGLMNETLVAVLKFADNVLKLEFIVAYTHKENTKSVRLLERNRFIHNSEFIDKENSNKIVFTRRSLLS